MRIAIPLVAGELSPHFGHCEEFSFVEVDSERKQILRCETAPAPPHQPGLLPRWLIERGADLLIAGGIGARARGILEAAGVHVLSGASGAGPEDTVRAWLEGSLDLSGAICDH
ncbi:MAG: ATPase [Kiritimatiellaeota bacterium]|nr:ATPase [Kiritimatiellota bacterium]